MVHLTDHMEGRTCCLLAVCAHFVQRKVILAYCGHTAAHGSNMPQVVRWCLDAVPPSSPLIALQSPTACAELRQCIQHCYALSLSRRYNKAKGAASQPRSNK